VPEICVEPEAWRAPRHDWRGCKTVEAPGGTEYELPIRLNRRGVSATGATISGGRLHLRNAALGGSRQRTRRENP